MSDAHTDPATAPVKEATGSLTGQHNLSSGNAGVAVKGAFERMTDKVRELLHAGK